MKKQLWLAPFACALSLAATQSQPLIAQNVIPDIRSAQPDGKAATFIVFDIPDTVCGRIKSPGEGPTGIDAAGTVVGSFQDCADFGTYAFYRLADGTIHRFHLGPVFPGTTGMYPSAVNASGIITGDFAQEINTNDFNQVGFLRDRVGNYTQINPFDSEYTIPRAINSAGIVIGEYSTDLAAGIVHGFVRDAEGNYTSFDSPGNGQGQVNLTNPTAINSLGSIVGYSTEPGVSNPVDLGFLRESNGNMTVLEIGQSEAVFPVAIADDGVVVGYFSKIPPLYGTPTSGFIRDAQGNYTTFSVPVAGTTETTPIAVDPQGSIVGSYSNGKTNPSAFYRLRDGTFGFFAPQGSTGTWPTAIGPQGDITGFFNDAAKHRHIFIRINPDPPATPTGQNATIITEPAK